MFGSFRDSSDSLVIMTCPTFQAVTFGGRLSRGEREYVTLTDANGVTLQDTEGLNLLAKK